MSTGPPSDGEGPGCPEEILEWIAWYPDGGLTDAQRGAVEAHAAGCPACRQELELLRCERPEAAGFSPEAEALFARVMERVGREEAGARESGGGPPSAGPAPQAADRSAVHPPVAPSGRLRGGALAASLLLGVLVGTGIARVLGGGGPSYRTAAIPEVAAPGPAAGPILEVVFADRATVAEIRAALQDLGAEVVGGPTEFGRFRLRLPPGRQPGEAARMLREGGVVIFAEPGAPRR